ncbi:VOC family protein [Paraburkholderia sediminicola]|uniref:VOC family protein n=1 Tax=Paraburkholderia sediminicola TaxID=458836 RepID=UPI0038B9040D
MKEQTQSAPPATHDLQSPRLSEIVLKTSRFEVVRDWYQVVLSSTPSFEYERPLNSEDGGSSRVENFRRLCFLRVFAEFPYTQVLAIFDVPNLIGTAGNTGLHHMQFRERSLESLVIRYERLLQLGVAPYQSFNHGPSTSFYYEDPDGNLVELSGPNYETEEEYLNFFKTPAFQKNPSGIEINVADFVRRYRAKERLQTLIRLPD